MLTSAFYLLKKDTERTQETTAPIVTDMFLM
jgi:hypothetical protein